MTAINRRRSLALFGALPPALLLGSAARAAEMVRVAAISAPGSADERLWFRFRDRAREILGDSVDIQLLIRGEIGSEEATLQAIRRNRVQIGGGTIAGAGAIVPELSVLTIPYLFDSEAELDFVLDNHARPVYAELLAEKGLHLQRWLNVGWVNLFSQEPLIAPIDAENRRLRAAASMAAQEFFNALSADTAYVPFTDVITSLQTGLIEGGATSVMMYAQGGIHQHAPHMTLTKHQYSLGLLVSPLRWWQGLPAEIRDGLDRALQTTDESRIESRAANQQLIDTMGARGATLHRLTPEQRAAWREASMPATEAVLDRVGGRARDIYQLVLDGKRAFAEQRMAP